jgi:hypothetical protein
MIRRRRLGDGSTSAITYIASTCTQVDANGLCIPDVTFSDPSNGGGSGAQGVGLPGDPSQAFAGLQNTLDINSTILSSGSADAGSTTASGNFGAGLIPLIDSPITVPDFMESFAKYILYGALAIAVLAIATEHKNSPTRRRS